VETYWDGQDWLWNTGHGRPPGTLMASAPAAVSWESVLQPDNPNVPPHGES
jgi:hypothetical protein